MNIVVAEFQQPPSQYRQKPKLERIAMKSDPEALSTVVCATKV